MSKFITLDLLDQALTSLATKIQTLFVAKEDGKGLSTNDYTTADKEKLSGLKNYTHPKSGVTAGTYRKVTVDAMGHVTAGDNPTTLSGYGITDAAPKKHTHGSDDITELDASKLTGKIDIARIPAGALERLVPVTNDEARFALTTEQVQNGDVVKVTGTNSLYYVVDDTKLSTEEGYEPYATGTAMSVSWGGITDKPSTFAPSPHTHTTSDLSDFKVATETDINNIISGAFGS